MEDFMLTTFDNPYDPFTQYDEWYQFDLGKGYDTCGLLARFAKTSDALTDEEYLEEVNEAMNRIISIFPEIYKKVKRNEVVEAS